MNTFVELNDCELIKINGGLDPEGIKNALIVASLFGGTAVVVTGGTILAASVAQAAYDAVTK